MDVFRRILILHTSIFTHFADKYFRTEGVQNSLWTCCHLFFATRNHTCRSIFLKKEDNPMLCITTMHTTNLLNKGSTKVQDSVVVHEINQKNQRKLHATSGYIITGYNE